MLIDEVILTVASERDRLNGLLAYVRCRLDGAILLDGITVRRTRDGRLTLSFPARRDKVGREHALVRPVDDAARIRFEDAVFAALPLEAR